MVVVLTAEEQMEGVKIFTRFWRWLTIKQVIAERRRILGCEYLILKVRNPVNPPWKKLRALAGQNARYVVTASGISLPEGCGLTLCPINIFHAHLAVAGACQAIAALNPDKTGIIGVYDPQGLYSWCCCSLLEHCSLLRVCTQYPQRYQKEAERLLQNYGALVILTPHPYELQGCDLVVALSPGKENLGLSQPVVAAPGCGIRGRPTVDNLIPASWQTEETIPPGVEPWLLLAAVFQVSPRPLSLMLTVASCRINGRAASLDELAFVVHKQFCAN